MEFGINRLQTALEYGLSSLLASDKFPGIALKTM